MRCRLQLLSSIVVLKVAIDKVALRGRDCRDLLANATLNGRCSSNWLNTGQCDS